MSLPPGIHLGVPKADYLALDALSASRMDWLAVSPLHYRYMLTQPPVETNATERGTALHAMLIEPDAFRSYAVEPDPNLIAPEAAKPRATKAYREAVAELEAAGKIVLKLPEMRAVLNMQAAILSNPHAARLFQRCPMHEAAILWDRDGRACRGRVDMLGDDLFADVKTVRSLRDFSPWVVTKLAYYRQAAWYQDGLKRLGRNIKHVFFIAVEATPPHETGVFVLDPDALTFGLSECEHFLYRLAECERNDDWPGMFEGIQTATLSASAIERMASMEEV